MEIAPCILLSLLLLLYSTAVAPYVIAPAADDHELPAISPAAASDAPDVYIVFVSRADYVDSVDYDIRLLASILGSSTEAKMAMIYHYSGVGFAARLAPEHAELLSRMDGVAVFKDRMYHVEKDDGRLPRFIEENI